MGLTKATKNAISQQKSIIEEACKSKKYSAEKFYNALGIIYSCYCVEESLDKLTKRRRKLGEQMSELGIAQLLVTIFKDLVDEQLPTHFVDNSCLENKLLKATQLVAGILHNYTDASAKFCTSVIESDELLRTLKMALHGLTADHFEQVLLPEVDGLVHSFVSIAYNLFLHDELDVVEKMQEVGMIDAVRPYLQSPVEETGTSALLLIIYLVDERQAQEVCADGKCLPYVLDCLKRAMGDDKKRIEGWSVSELLRALGRLSALDVNKKKLGELGAIDLMKSLLKDGDQSEVGAALKILWQLSFEVENARRIRAAQLEPTIKAMAKDSDPRALQRQANGLLWTLEERLDQPSTRQGRPRSEVMIARRLSERHISVDKTDAKLKKSPELPRGISVPASSSAQQHLMISYEAASHGTVLKIGNFLIKNGHKVWMRSEDLLSMVYKDLALAIENAWLVLVAVSRKYKDDEDCRREAEYAVSLKKKIIPLKMGSYDADGWLGIITAGKIYINFGKEDEFEAKCSALLRGISQLKSDSIRL